MEDGDDSVEPAAVVGRRVDITMGSVRFGGSGRPVPSVLAATRGAGRPVQPVREETRARKGGARTMNAPMAISLSPRNLVVARPRPRQVIRTADSSAVTVSKMETRRSAASFASRGQNRLKKNSPPTRIENLRTRGSEQSRRRDQQEVISEEDDNRPTHVAQHDLEARAADFKPHSPVGAFLDSGAVESHTDSLERLQDSTHAVGLLHDSSAKADIDDDHSYRLMEGVHRRPETTQKRYHVAFHPPVSSSLASQAVEVATRAPTLVSQRYQDDAQPLTVLSSPLVGNFNAEARGHDIWKSVDDSINQLYEDPPIDLVKNTLFHANLSADGLSRTRRKQKQRERILAAAEELREVKTQQQVERDQARRRKKQIQAMSETIRRHNKKFARSIDDTGAIDDAKSHPNGESHHNHSAVSITERKPPVPRLSGSRVKPSKRKRSKRREGSDRSETETTRVESTAYASAATGTRGNGAAASILLGDLSTSGTHEQQDAEDQENTPDMAAVPLTRDDNTGDQSLIRRSNKHRAAPRRSATLARKAHKSDESQDDGRKPRPSEALDHRRAIAREYMLLQQQQRMIRKSEAQQREAMEREKRRQQLELLEKRRLENLKHSRKCRSPRKQVPARRRGKARAKAPEASQNSLVFAGSDQDSGEEMKRVSRSMTNGEQHQLSDAENDGTQGNIVVGHQRQEAFGSPKSPSSVAPASRNLLFGGVEVVPSLIVSEKEQPDAANPHIQKLLDLRRKAQELSQRLSDIHSAQKIPEKQPSRAKVLSIEPDKSRDHVVDSGNHVIDQSLQIPEREEDGRSQDSDAQSPAAKLDLLGHDSGVDGMNDEAEDSEDDGSDEEAVSDGVEQDDDTVEDAKQESEEDEFANDESSVNSETRLQDRDTASDVSRYDMSSALVDMSDGIDVDVRSIGVYNIAVVWPLANDHPTTDESGQRFTEITSSSSSASSSQPDESGSEYGGEFEQMRGDGVDDSASNRDSDSDKEMEMAATSPKRDERTRRTSEEWSAEKMAELLYSIDSMSKFSTSEQPRNDRVGFAMASWRLGMGSAPSDTFNQLVRAEDDSLSVIQRTALKLYERQEELERLRRENEKQHQQEHDTLDSPSESFERDHEDDSPARQFARLDEIMQEVDRERSLANEMREISDDELNEGGDVDSNEASSDHGERIPRARGHTTASSEFWNQLISQSAIEKSQYDEVEEEAQRSHVLSARATRHVEIDTSELEAQRMKQLRLADYEQEDDDDDVDALDDLDQRARSGRKRVHSPRSLAKRLLAEVEYHEAINDAHLKLTAMEQAQLLEEAQAETINIATAFKEEMEQNAVNHQLALDHVTLAKRFDDDLHDVAQQLHSIDEIEEQKHTARQIAAGMQLKQAQMRECSVQTENPRVADVGTSAPLHVDAGTSPIVPSVSTAVQYEFSGSPASAGSPSSKLQVSIVEEEGDVYEITVVKPLIADDSEAIDYGDEGFEQESGLHSRSYGVQGGVVVEEEEIHSEEESATSATSAAVHESKAESVVESATSLTGSNIVASGSGSGEIEEVSDDDRVVADSITHSEADGHVESATVNYEDDFNASSPTAMARSVASNEVDDDFEAESEYGDEAAGGRDDQSVDEVDEEDEGEDEVEDEPAVRRNGVDGVDKDASVEDDFEDEFAQSVDNEVDGEEKLQEDDAVEDDQIIEDRSAQDTHAVTKEELAHQLPNPLGRSAMTPPPASIEANMQFSGFYAGGFGYPQQFATPPPSLYSLPVADAGQSDEVIQAYMAELERRKQSETVMLCIRLQAAEAHFSHQAKRIDSALADTKADAAAKAELAARKQRLTIAFMGEKANIESLKAAATARYFQDMLSFQSLYANDLPSVAIADGTSLGLRDSPYIAAPTAQMYAPNVAPQAKSLAAKTTSVGAESECYEDEFALVTQDEAGNIRGSIAKSVEKSVVEGEDAYESEEHPCDVSVESEVEQVSQEQEGENADRLQSEADIESDFEDETRDKSMEEDDSKHPVEEGEVESDEYAQSEFEDETPDMPEEQAAAEEMAPQDEINGFDEETEIAESGEVASKVGDSEDEIETSEIHEDNEGHLDSEGQAETHSTKTYDIEDGGGYDDDFASVSGSMQRQGSSHTSGEDAVVEEEAQHDSGGVDVVDEVESIPSVVSSEQDHEISSARSEDEINEIPGGVVRESNASASAAAYSEDEFEEPDHAEASQPDSKQTLNVAESVVISTSDDSSTTKLLVAEVDAVQNTVAAGGDITHATDAQSDKLMRKKAKVVELLEAKKRLLHQQTRAFRLEEEKRMVNEAAHLALSLDISQELREAKAKIVNELQSEFDALKASFPKLKRLTTPLNTDTAAIGDEPASQCVAEVEQPVVAPAGAESRDNSNINDYDVQSFEAASESGAANRSIREEDEDLANDASIADDTSDRVQASVASEKYSEFGEDESTAEEDIRDDVSGAGADSVQSEVTEEQFESHGEGDGAVPSDGAINSEDDGYENDYENESFADAQSAASVVDDDDIVEQTRRSELVTVEAETGDVAARSTSAVQSDAASEYTEDDFEQASESEAALSVHGDGFEDENEEEASAPSNTTPTDHQGAETTVKGDAQSSVSDHELSAALATVESKLAVEGEGIPHQSEGLPYIEKSSELALDRADESTRELVVNALTPALESRPDGHSTSVSSEEETLTKSIEERMARLEKLRTLILERQNDIRQVHKQLRIEKRKEVLTSEEKKLWAEVEGLEHELQCDVASLELIRQRNRLEFNQLEARQQRISTNPLGFERDLLAGFDYIEGVELCITTASLRRDADVQTPSVAEVECQTVATPPFRENLLISTYVSDLLAGYDYVEHAQEVVAPAAVTEDPNDDSTVAGPITDPSVDDEESPEREQTAIKHSTEEYDTLEEQDHSVDLLLGYAFVEAVEPLCVVEADLLAGFDYTEDVEMVAQTQGPHASEGALVDRHLTGDTATGECERSSENVDELSVPASGDSHQCDDQERSPAAITSVDIAERNGLLDATDAAEQPDSGEDEEGAVSDDVYEENASPPPLSTQQRLEVGDHDHETDSAEAPVINDGEEATREASGEPDTTETDATAVDTISSLILADLLQDMDSGAMLELKAWRKARPRAQVSSSKAMPLDSTRAETGERSVTDPDCNKVNRDYQRSELDAASLQVGGTAVNTPSTTKQSGYASDLAAKTDAATESIFSALFEDVLLSQLRAGVGRRTSWQQSEPMPLVEPKGLEAAASSSPTPSSSGAQLSHLARQQIENSNGVVKAAARQRFIDQTLSTLQVVDNCIRLEGFSSLECAGLMPDSARLLYDAIAEIGQAALDAHYTADLTVWSTISSMSSRSNDELLRDLRQAVRRELEAANAIQTEQHEAADLRLKAIADADDQLDDDDVALLRQFSARPLPASSLVATAASTWIARPPVTLTTSFASGSAFTPRTPTPTSRGKSRARRSLLTLAQSRQSAELQRRITSAIFDELLEDATGVVAVGPLAQPLK